MRPNQIIARNTRRHKKALQIASTEGAITRNGSDGQYYVQSQADRGRYLVAHPRLSIGPLCNCKDWTDFGQHQPTVIHCKHITASVIWEKAIDYTRRLSSKHNLNLSQFEARLLSDLSAGTPEPMTSKLMVILAATRHLDAQSCTDRVCETCQNRLLCQNCDHDPRNTTSQRPPLADRSPLAGFPREWPAKEIT